MVPQPKIIILTETFLHCAIADNEMGLHNYVVYRRDKYDYAHSPYGGGLLIAVHKELQSTLIYNNRDVNTVQYIENGMDSINLEHLFVEVSTSTCKIIFGAVYLPPGTNKNFYEEHVARVESLKRIFKDHEFIVAGDYNLKKTNWYNNEEGLDSICSNSDKRIQESASIITNGFSFMNFFQLFSEHPRKGYTLDLVLSSLDNQNVKQIHSLDSFVTPKEDHHEFAYFEIALDNYSVISDRTEYYNFDKADYVTITDKLKNTKWDEFFDSPSLTKNVDKFYNYLHNLIKSYVPHRKSSPSTYPVWYSKELISCIIKKKKLHKIWLQSDSLDDHIEFKKYRAKCIRLSRACYQEYMANVEAQTCKNIKYFWNYINKLKKNNGIPDSMFLGDAKADNTKDICDLFSNNFKSVYRDSTNINDNDNFSYIPSFEARPFNVEDITFEDISTALAKMSVKPSVGPDFVPSSFLKNCNHSILPPLRILFCQSLAQGYMPEIWKRSYVTPVYKNGNSHDIVNYRPISILCSIAKLFESIITVKLTEHFIDIISESQHGFVESKSAVTNLVVYSDYIVSAFVESRQVDSIYLDFAKAFDSVDHGILLHKLSKLGIYGNLLDWLKSYLNNRSQIVRIKGNESDPVVVTSGVPQGSHLGPFLFLLFVNDIADNLKFAKILMYADDIKLYIEINSPLDASKLQRDLDSIVTWSKTNKLNLNINKCKIISFCKSSNVIDFNYTVATQVLEKVDTISDLGVVFEKKLDFGIHLDAVVSRAMNTLGFVMRSTREFTNIDTIIYLYKTLVLSKLTYCSQIWSPHYEVDYKKLESIQRKFLRYISYKQGRPMHYFDHDYSNISISLKLNTVQSVHTYNDILLVRQVLYGYINSQEMSRIFEERQTLYNLRGSKILTEKKTSSVNTMYHATTNRLRRLWNDVSNDLKTCTSLDTFKRLLKQSTSCFY